VLLLAGDDRVNSSSAGGAEVVTDVEGGQSAAGVRRQRSSSTRVRLLGVQRRSRTSPLRQSGAARTADDPPGRARQLGHCTQTSVLLQRQSQLPCYLRVDVRQSPSHSRQVDTWSLPT